MQWLKHGPELEIYRISNKIMDIHPIGGIEDKGFCVYDLYGKNKDKHVDSVKKQFLY